MLNVHKQGYNSMYFETMKEFAWFMDDLHRVGDK